VRRQGVGIKHDRLILRVKHWLQLSLLERHPCVARQRQHHQNGVDLVRHIEQIDALLQAAAVHPLRGHIDRIARRAIGGKQCADFGLNRVRQFRHLQALHRDRVRAPDAGAARHGQHSNAIPRGHRVGRQHGCDSDGLIEIVGNDKTIFGEYRVVGRGPASHAGGVRRRRALTRAGAADLGNDDGLAGLRGAPGGGEEFVDIANALDEQQDHVGRDILHHVVEEFAGAEVGFVAGADDITERYPERLGAVVDRKADAAALRDDADPPSGRDQPRRVRLAIDGRAEGGGNALDLAVESFRVGAGNPHAGLLRQRSDGVLHGRAVAALFREARRDDHRVLDADGGALLERA